MAARYALTRNRERRVIAESLDTVKRQHSRVVGYFAAALNFAVVSYFVLAVRFHSLSMGVEGESWPLNSARA